MNSKDFQNGFIIGMAAKNSKINCINKRITKNGEYSAVLDDEAIGYKKVFVEVEPRSSGLPLDLTTDAGELATPEELTSISENLKYIFPNSTASIVTSDNIATAQVTNDNKYVDFSYRWFNGQPVNCLTSTGTQYINTGVTADSYISYEVEYFTTTIIDAYKAILGSRHSSSSQGLTLFHTKNNDKNTKLVQIGNTEYSDTFPNKYWQTYCKVKYDARTNALTISDCFGNSDTIYGTPSVWSNNYPIYLFAVNQQNSVNSPSNTSLISCRIWSSDQLVRSFIPKVSTEETHENEPCLFDEVNNTYYYNAGTDSFIFETTAAHISEIENTNNKQYQIAENDKVLLCNVFNGTNSEIDITSTQAIVNNAENVSTINESPLTITGDTTQTSQILTVESDNIQLDQCDIQWQRGKPYVRPLDGNSFFDLEIMPLNSCTYEITFSDVVGNDKPLFGATNTWSYDNLLALYANNMLNIGDGNSKYTAIGCYKTNNCPIYNIKFNKETLSINGRVKPYTNTHNPAIVTSLKLFTAGGRYGNYKLYNFKVYNNDILTHDLVPYLNTDTNEVCLLNKVDNSYIQSSGEFDYGFDNTYFDNLENETETTYMTQQARQTIRCLVEGKKDGACFGSSTSDFITVGTDISALTAQIDADEKAITTVPYLQSSGTQFIDTGYKPKANSWFKIVCSFKERADLNEVGFLFGSRISTNNENISLNFSGAGSNSFFIGRDSGYYQGTVNWLEDTQYEIIVKPSDVTLDGTVICSQSSTLNRETANSLYLFACNEAGTASRNSIMKLCSFEIYEDDVQVSNFVPKLSQEEDFIDKPCLFDTINQTYFYNQGTDEFVYGENHYLTAGGTVTVSSTDFDASSCLYQWYNNNLETAPTNMFMDNTGLICTINGRSYYKLNEGAALVGYGYHGSYTGPVLVSTIPEAVEFTGGGSFAGTFVHNGVTWYVSSLNYWMSGNRTDSSGLNRVKISINGANAVILGKALFDKAEIDAHGKLEGEDNNTYIVQEDDKNIKCVLTGIGNLYGKCTAVLKIGDDTE